MTFLRKLSRVLVVLLFEPATPRPREPPQSRSLRDILLRRRPRRLGQRILRNRCEECCSVSKSVTMRQKSTDPGMSNYWKSLCFKTLMAGGGLSIIEPADGFRTKTEHGLNQSLPRGSKDESLTVTRWHDAARLLLDR